MVTRKDCGEFRATSEEIQSQLLMVIILTSVPGCFMRWVVRRVRLHWTVQESICSSFLLCDGASRANPSSAWCSEDAQLQLRHKEGYAVKPSFIPLTVNPDDLHSAMVAMVTMFQK